MLLSVFIKCIFIQKLCIIIHKDSIGAKNHQIPQKPLFKRKRHCRSLLLKLSHLSQKNVHKFKAYIFSKCSKMQY